MQAKITSVYDEGSLVGTQLIGAEGFAVLIEAGGKKILFDTGRRGRYLLHNLMFLDVKPEDIDKVVISHAHANHTGGIDDILRGRESHLNIYAPRSAVGIKKMFGPKGVRVPEELSEKAAIIEVNDWMEASDKVFISCPMDAGKGMTECFMVIRARKGPAVISACSHPGVDNVMEAVKKKFGEYPRTYIGGVHIGKKDKEKAAGIATSFKENNCSNLHLNHCTGVSGTMYLRTSLGLKSVDDFYVGSAVSVDL
jgi:7,8-dihydropterin-6-yl-methyl-4-(beta-D-ribofuranosyl)aminobenzene 5'-phosphate synthase